MNTEYLLPYYTTERSPLVGMFNTAMGKLQRQLRKGEYDIFKSVPVFESDFIEVTKRGMVIDVHNRGGGCMTMGIANTNPFDPIPDVLLVARLVPGHEEHVECGQANEGKVNKATATLELTRLLPLTLVKISIHNRNKHRLCLKLATGRSHYLQLCAPPDQHKDLFACWEDVIDLLSPPVEAYSSTHAIPAGDMFTSVFEEMDRRSPEGAHFQGTEDQREVSIRTIYVMEATAAVSAASAGGGERTQQDFHKPTTMPKAAAPDTQPTWHARESAARTEREEVTAEEPVARAMTPGADGVAAGTMAGAFSMIVTASEPLSTALARAATECAGGSKTNTAISGGANMCPESIKMSLEGATDKAPECSSSVSALLYPEDSVRMATAGAALASKIVGEAMKGTGVLASPTSTLTLRRHQAGRQLRLSPASPEAHEGRRERREESALRSSPPRRAADSRHKAGGDKIPHKPGDRTLGGQRAPRGKEEGRRSSGCHRHVSSREEVSPAHTPTAEASRASHKLGGTKSSGSSPKLHSSIGSLLGNIKARLSGRPSHREVGTVERTRMETIIKSTARDWRWLGAEATRRTRAWEGTRAQDVPQGDSCIPLHLK
ncbi:hypothetical protein MC885_010967 [Smutsia gigantea]|nr:hypothetical protein MC885_010967 [Smutsia gigantea]